MIEHKYISTYCLHDLCGDCRLTCKHCDAPCLCGCHQMLTPQNIADMFIGSAVLEANFTGDVRL